MYLYRLLYVLSGLLLILGILLVLPGAGRTVAAMLPSSLEAELGKPPILALFAGAFGALFVARTLQLLVNIRDKLYRIENELSDFDGYPM
ncbi:MAG: hypothetical protein ABEL04_12375 [Salinibacter sp.]|uniref:hypothetical protein n=1 Tax=Salinibacter sp. TaxID=2065818 RepID=UPI0035D5275A